MTTKGLQAKLDLQPTDTWWHFGSVNVINGHLEKGEETVEFMWILDIENVIQFEEFVEGLDEIMMGDDQLEIHHNERLGDFPRLVAQE